MKPSSSEHIRTETARYLAGASLCVLLVVLFVPHAALGHTGAGSTEGLLRGLTHPLGGLDHLLAMVAVGLLAAQRGGRALWAIPLAFVSVMALGAALAFAGAPLPRVESGILLSVLLLGVLVATAKRLPLVASVAIAGSFGLLHGHAHGTEMPASASGLAYGVGFVVASAALHAAGIGIATSFQKANQPRLTRLAGAVVAVGGVGLVIG